MFNDLITSLSEWEISLRPETYQRIAGTLGAKPKDDFPAIVRKRSFAIADQADK